MAVFYKAKQSVLKTKDGKKKWYPVLERLGTALGTHDIARMIAETTSLSPGDVHNVIRSLPAVMHRELLNSNSINLEGLGSFSLSAHAAGNGVDTFEEVSHKQINRLSVNFTPSYTLPSSGGVVCPMTEGAVYKRIDGLTPDPSPK